MPALPIASEVKRDQRARGRILGGRSRGACAHQGKHHRGGPGKAELLAYARQLRGEGLSLRAIEARLAERDEVVSHVVISRAVVDV